MILEPFENDFKITLFQNTVQMHSITILYKLVVMEKH